MSVPKVKRQVGKYELGHSIGEGRFAKVRLARNLETEEQVAIKIISKEKVLKHKLVEQIKREIATMKLIKHPNVIRLHEVMGSKSKIFIVLEYATGGELLNNIIDHGRMGEAEARRYFHQLINAIDFCHSRGVYHRDLKLDNLLLDASGNLKLSDFGFSTLSQKVRIAMANFTFPSWFSFGAKTLLMRILNPNPKTRITISEILEDEWFRKGDEPSVLDGNYETNLNEVHSAFKISQDHHETGNEEQPAALNAFELIGLSKGLNLESLFTIEQALKRETRFTSTCSANEIVRKIEDAAKPLGYDIHKKNYKMMLRNVKAGRKGNLNVSTEVFQVAPSLHMVEVRKDKGDTLEFQKFYKTLSASLKDVIWMSEED
ncbi:CBL-interacting protein kinase 33-like isoform X6 [Phalaenopsis equestris]|uniref:CBL-interacting protein kinase 33-like isoform X6 n=1 Tax=Phalaenopsis equestris TaxID=78828 RepID=UPI0009E2D544|nr:CBL-interacting protein kinase 33-like isoform X6 [Phalaenopsis equestris]